MVRLGELIKAWADNSTDRMETCSNEQRVRQYLVLPLLQALGDHPIQSPTSCP